MFEKIVSLIVVAAVVSLGLAAGAESPSTLLEKGIYTEETVGDLDAAIEIYDKVIAEGEASREFVAQAQFRRGQCLLKQGKKEEAEKAFGEFVNQFKDFPKQKALVEKARKLLPWKSELKLDPAPWVDGEHLEFRIKLGGGLDIGDIVMSARSRKVEHRYAVKFEAGGVNGVLQSIRQVKPGDMLEYGDQDLGFSLSAPADWYFIHDKASAKPHEHVATVVDPGSESVTAIRVQPADRLEDEQRASIRTWAESKVAEAKKEHQDYRVRADSRQERTVGGLPAVSFIADYVQSEKPRVQYRVLLLGKSTAASFAAETEPDRVDGFRKKFDKIIDTFKAS